MSRVNDDVCRALVRLLLSYGANPLHLHAERLSTTRQLLRTAEDLCFRVAPGGSFPFPLRRCTQELLGEVRLAGGYRRYLNSQRESIVVLRELCLRGRAAPPPALARLFPVPERRRQTMASRRARNDGADAHLIGGLSVHLFWHVMKFWRSERDYLPPHRNTGYVLPAR